MRKARDPQPLAEARGPAARLTTRTVFLAVLALVLAAYTVLAMDLAWRSQSGQLGPGFFPRIIGVIGVALCLAALAKSLRTKAGGEVGGEVDGDIDGDIDGDVDVEPELGRHPGILTVVVLACVAFYFLLVPFGGVIASVALLLGTLMLLDRGHPVVNVAVATLLPLGLYLLFERLLDADLPSGLLWS